jgi:hypothetical protein
MCQAAPNKRTHRQGGADVTLITSANGVPFSRLFTPCGGAAVSRRSPRRSERGPVQISPTVQDPLAKEIFINSVAQA